MSREGKGVRLAAVCDADLSHAEGIKKSNPDIKIYQDVRELLDDKSIDAISTATPNHWHALVTVWACKAGKDVYVEKPASYEIWEGRKTVEAARKYNRIVQVGTQKRSSMAHKEAFEWIHAGNIGAIKWSRGFCYKYRGPGSRGIVNGTNGPTQLPENIDYNQTGQHSFPRTSTITSGAARPIWYHYNGSSCIINGTGSGTQVMVTSATRVFTRWTWPAGHWVTVQKNWHRRYAASAEDSVSMMPVKHPTR
jgi:hypothetical protein